MQREIKFRVWNGKTGKMVGISQKNLWRSKLIPAADEILMEYSGLDDKHGVEIYESDILRTAGGKQYEVKWNNDIAGWDCFGSYHTLAEVADQFEPEVIGNIYQNKDLLK